MNRLAASYEMGKLGCLPRNDRPFPWRQFVLYSIVVIMVAAGVRWLNLYHFSRENPFYDTPVIDAAEFDGRALAIMKGSWIPERVSIHGPLYPAILAGVYMLCGEGPTAPRCLQHFLGVLSVYIIFVVGFAFFSPAAGLTAGVWMGLYPVFIFYESLLLMTSLVVFLDLGGLFCFVIFQKRGAGIFLFLSAFFWGISVLARPNALFLIAAFSFLLIIRPGMGARAEKHKWPDFLIFGLTVLLIVSPLVFINHRLSGAFVIQDHLGLNAFIGNNPDSNGTPYLRPGPRYEQLVNEPLDHGARGIKGRNSYFIKKVMEFAFQHPRSFIRLWSRKLLLLFSDHEITDSYAYAFLKNYSPVLKFNPLGFAPMFAFFGLGAFLLYRKGGPLRTVFMTFLTAYAASLIPFVVSSRYRAPMLPLMILLASIGFLHAAGLLRRRRFNVLCKVMLSAGVLFLISFMTRDMAVNSDHYEPYYLLGNIYKIREEYSDSKRYYLKALAVNGGYAEAYNKLGEVYMLLDEREKARESFSNALSIIHSYYDALVNIGDLHYKSGKRDMAEKEYLRAIESDPRKTAAYNNLAVLCYERGDISRALELISKVLSIDPDNRVAKNNYQRIIEKENPPDRSRFP